MELLPCPFCGSKEIKLHQQHWHMSRKAQCIICHSESTYNRENEIKTWNTRHYPWISVKEQIPLFVRELLLIVLNDDKKQYLEIGFLRKSDKNNMIFLDKKGYPINNKVTHWQYSPQLPKETE